MTGAPVHRRTPATRCLALGFDQLRDLGLQRRELRLGLGQLRIRGAFALHPQERLRLEPKADATHADPHHLRVAGRGHLLHGAKLEDLQLRDLPVGDVAGRGVVPVLQLRAGDVAVLVLHLEVKPLARKPLLVVIAHRLVDDVCRVAWHHDADERTPHLLVGIELHMELGVRVRVVAVERHDQAPAMLIQVVADVAMNRTRVVAVTLSEEAPALMVEPLAG